MDLKQGFEYLNTIGIEAPAANFKNFTIGDAPVPFDWIGGQRFQGTDMTGIHSTIDHGLKVGDQVTLTSTNARYSGKFAVAAIGADDGTYKNSIFCIAVVKGASEIATGTWQLATSANTNTNTNLTQGKSITIMGKSFTYTEVAGFFGTLVLLGLALAFPLKTPKELKAEYNSRGKTE